MRQGPLAYPPKCPFCGRIIDKPKELKSRKPLEFPMGICECGAVYAFDVTGHNLGAAHMEALVFASNDDWDLALDLHDSVYKFEIIEHYDGISHQVVPGRNIEGGRVNGALFFVKLNENIQEFTGAKEGLKSKLKEPTPTHLPQRLRSKAFSKKEVKRLVEENKPDELIAIAEQDTRVITALQKLLYSVDEIIRWRTIKMLGMIAEKLGDKIPGSISNLLRRLLSATDDTSSGSGWGAIETIGEIVNSRPDLFGEFTQPLISFLEKGQNKKEVTWAIGKIAEKKPELVKYVFLDFISFLNDPDATVRGYAAWSLGNIGKQEAKENLKNLENDKSQVSIFENGEINKKTVGQIATEAIGKLKMKNEK